jgi:hypothetical protein
MTGEGLGEGQSLAFHRRDAYLLVEEWMAELTRCRQS